MSESEMKVNETMVGSLVLAVRDLDSRLIALERGLEAVLRRMEASTSPDDEPGWFGVDE